MISKSNEIARSSPLEIVLIAYVILAPLFWGSVYPWAYHFFSALFFLTLFFCPEILDEIKTLPVVTKIGAGLICIFLSIQTFAISQNSYNSESELLKWLAMAAAFLAVQKLDRHGLKRLIFAIILVGFAEALYGLIQLKNESPMILWQSKEFYLDSATGTYINRNHFAGFLEICLGINLGWLVSSIITRKYLAAICSLGGLMLGLTALLRSASRMGVASFVLAAAVFLLILIAKEKMRGILAASLLALIVAIAAKFGAQTIFARYLELSDKAYSLTGRIAVWKDTLELIQDFSLTGIGLGAYKSAASAYLSSRALQGWAHAHNDYLELMAELGLPCFVFLIFAFMGLLGRICRALFSSPHFSPWIWGGSLSIFSFLIHSFLDFNLAIPANAGLFILTTAILVRYSEIHLQARPV